MTLSIGRTFCRTCLKKTLQQPEATPEWSCLPRDPRTMFESNDMRAVNEANVPVCLGLLGGNGRSRLSLEVVMEAGTLELIIALLTAS